jgi:hypothetical protein
MIVSNTSAVPRTAAEITPAWFTEAFRAAGLLTADASVADLKHIPVGNGLVCDSSRFDLTYDQHVSGEAPSTVVCKFPSLDADHRAAAVADLVYSRELGFYQHLATSLDVRTPRGVYLDHDAATHDFVLVLEDLAPARGGDQIAGCSLAEAEAVLDAATGLHAPYWGSPDLDEAEWNVRPVWIPRVSAGYPAMFAQFATEFGPRVAASDLAIGQAFAPVVGQWFAAQRRPWTITHGDFRLDNILFDIHGGAEPVGVLDWQTLLPGPGAADVSYFLGGCLPIEVRRANEDELLRHYHTSLVKRGVTDYSFEQCHHDYRYNAFLGYFMASYAACLVRHTERGDAMFALWLQRAAAQIHDLDCLSLLPAP